MCCLFGIHDYGHSLSRKQKSKILSVLSTASEARGTDATGIAYNSGGKLCVYKRPIPAHLMWFRVPEDGVVIMGHTRMTTQGNEKWNWNNHPFLGSAGNTSFALAHNGVLHNDLKLRKKYLLPITKIETDSYIAVQLIEKTKELSFDSLRYMAEQVLGSFTFTVLSENHELYFVKGDNPMCIYHYPERGLYLYASTEGILNTALRQLPFHLGVPVRINLSCGEILCIDAMGQQSCSSFDASNLFPLLCDPWTSRCHHELEPYSNGSYVEDLKAVAVYYGLYPEEIDRLLADGFTTDEIEEMLYCG